MTDTPKSGNRRTEIESEALQDGSEYYRALIEFSADAIISIDTLGTIELFNKAAEKLFGYAQGEIVGQNIKKLMPAPYQDAHDGYLAAFVKTGKANVIGRWREVEGLRKDGVKVPIEIGIREFWLDGKQIFTGIVRDLTEIKRAQQITDASAATLEGIAASQAMIEFKMDGTIVTANENYLQAMGYNLAEIEGKHHSIFVTPTYKESAEYQEFWKDLKAGNFQAGEFKRVDKGGKDVWIQASYNPVFDPDGNPVKIVKNAVVITKKKLAMLEAEAIAERQRKDILELSTPALSIWKKVLLLPLIGTLDSYRMKQSTELALNRMREANAHVMIIDITGVPVMDTMVANHLMSLASSIRLMGGQCILTGISPATAITIVSLGVNLNQLETRSSLQDGLKLAISLVAAEGPNT